MRGRNRELSLLLDMIRLAEAGRAGVLLVEGEPGIGKTSILQRAAEAASERGFFLAAGDAGDIARQLTAGIGPVAGGTTSAKGLSPATLKLAARSRVAGDLSEASRLGTAAARTERNGGHSSLAEHRWAARQERPGNAVSPGSRRGNLLVLLDDVQAAGPVALEQLRTLPSRVRAPGSLCILARGPGGSGRSAERLFEHLERSGAMRMELAPLDDDSVEALVSSTVGAVPGPSLRALVAEAGGNPLLLIELLRGLREEKRIKTWEGTAHVVSGAMPVRLARVIRRWLADLGSRVKHLLEVGAVLGRSFQVDDLAALVRDTPARLLPDIEAALAARILAPVGASLMFRRRLVWHAVEESVPVPARQALHRQVAEYLLERGGSVTEAAAHLVSGSRPCDPVALARLDRVARIHRLTSPQTGADLAVKALELTGPGDGRRLTRLETAVEALAAAGRLCAAEALARSALSQPMPAGMSARLRGMLSAIVLQDGRPGAAVAEAEAVLGERALTSRPRTHAEFVLMLGMSVAGGDGGWGPALADATLAISEQGKEGDVAVVGALLVQALDRWRDGRLGQSLGLAREAARRGMRLPAFGGHMLPRLLLAHTLVQAGHLDEAASVLRSVRRDAGDLGAPGRDASAEILMASMALAAGHHDDAVSGTQQGLALADLRGTHLFSQLGTSILATAALRTGDLRLAVQHTDALGQQQAADAPCFGRTQSLVVTAQVTEASEGAAEGAALVTPLFGAVARNPSVLLAGSATAGWLTRFALAQQHREQAAGVAAAAADLAAANPGLELCAALAAHARGLVDGDAALLQRAAQRSRDPWAKASAHEDLGVLLIGQSDLPWAGRSLEEGLGGYDACGATRDARRVRRRLRKLGIRRRHFSYANRPKSGWDSLTDTERAVSELVAQGLTNQKIANEMFLSTHTVAFHLRQVFRKLDISSRVDLARLLTERSHDTTTQQAS